VIPSASVWMVVVPGWGYQPLRDVIMTDWDDGADDLDGRPGRCARRSWIISSWCSKISAITFAGLACRPPDFFVDLLKERLCRIESPVTGRTVSKYKKCAIVLVSWLTYNPPAGAVVGE